MEVSMTKAPIVLLLVHFLQLTSALANGVLPGLSYLPPRPDNTVFEVGRPAITISPASPPLSMLIPAADRLQIGPSAGVQYPAGAPPPPPPAAAEPSCGKACPFTYDPMCGSDGVTYTNECTFSVAACKSPNLLLKSVGSCASRPSPGRPSVPAFPPPPPPPRPSRPSPSAVPVVIPFPYDTPAFQTLPGSGVIPFPPSLETLGDIGGTGATFDPLPSTGGCLEACTKIYIPLCGTDGVTYNNKCLLDLAICRGSATGQTIDVAFEGTCGSLIESVDIRGSSFHSAPFSSPLSSCDKQCTKIFNPVCGSDDVTYNNPCLLDVASCQRTNAGGAPITLVYEGQCAVPDMALFIAANINNQQDFSASLSSQATCPEECTKIFSPVCGTDGQTYNNQCVLNVAACKSRSVGDVLFKDFEGPCVAALPRGPACDPSCDKTFLPVCGSDGETYNNICLLNYADCLNPFAAINYASDGPCETKSAAGLSTDPRPSISTEPRDEEFFLSVSSNVNTAQEREYIPPV